MARIGAGAATGNASGLSGDGWDCCAEALLRAGLFLLLVILVVASSDLSHYHDDETAKRLDRRTATAIIGKHADELAPGDACGVFALQGLVAFAGERGLDIELLDLRTSADTMGNQDRVVGYGSFAVR